MSHVIVTLTLSFTEAAFSSTSLLVTGCCNKISAKSTSRKEILNWIHNSRAQCITSGKPWGKGGGSNSMRHVHLPSEIRGRMLLLSSAFLCNPTQDPYGMSFTLRGSLSASNHLLSITPHRHPRGLPPRRLCILSGWQPIVTITTLPSVYLTPNSSVLSHDRLCFHRLIGYLRMWDAFIQTM